MKVSRAPDGVHVLTSGVSVSITRGRELSLSFGPGGQAVPPRQTVQRELDELTGMTTWLLNWPAADSFPPDVVSDAVVLDYDEQARAADDLLTLGALLSEVVELGLTHDLGWTALDVDPTRLKTFGGERPSVPSSFFWRWGNGEPKTEPTPLSWDADALLVAATPTTGPFRIPRRPSLLFRGEVARLSGLGGHSDDEAFAALAECLPWSAAYELITLPDYVPAYFLPLRDRTGKEVSDGIAAVIRQRPQCSREVVAVCAAGARRRPDVLDRVRKELGS